MRKKRYCPFCKAKLLVKFIEDRDRLYCPVCREPLYENAVPVTAAVVFNEKKELLLVKRSVEPQIGEWCLPGGFVEVDETPEQACLRELAEETALHGELSELVGIFLAGSERYTSVLMIGYLIKNFKGKPEAGDDADRVAFFPLADVPELAFPSHRKILDKAIEKNMASKITRSNIGTRLENMGAYVITSQDHISLAKKACRGGARIIQYRDKGATHKQMWKTATSIRGITIKCNCIFIVNDFIDLAIIVGADGVHLGQDDIPLKQVRRIVPPGFIIGISTHSVAQAQEAERDGADYIGIGPVFATPTKADYAPIGINIVKKVLDRVKIPVVAIGGISLDNIAALHKIGIKNVAMVRAFRQDTLEVVNKVNGILQI